MDEQHAPLVVAHEIEQSKSDKLNNVGSEDSRAPNLPTSDRVDKLDPDSLNYGSDFEEQMQRPASKYRDILYLVLFIVNGMVVLSIGLFGGLQCMTGNGNCMNANTNPHHSQSANERPRALLAPMVVSFVVASMMCSIMIVILQWYSESFLKCILVTSVLLQFGCGLFMFFINPLSAVLLIVFSAFTCCYYVYVRNRLEFAGAVLEIACSAIRRYPTSIMVAFGSLFVQFLVVIIWALAYYGAVASSIAFGSFVLETYLLFSLFWALTVVQNVAHCSTCGVVGCWWFTNNDAAVSGSLKRASTTSLGSICFGSLIVAILKTLRLLVRQFRKANERGGRSCLFIAHCAEYMLSIIEHYARYLNSYAYCFVALYGKDFRTAGREVQAMFDQRGWTAVINDDLVSKTLGVANLGVGAVTGFAGGLSMYLGYAGSEAVNLHWVGAVALLSFFVGMLLAFTVSGVITSAVRTVFVCYAKASDVLEQTRPEANQRLTRAWLKFYPDITVHAQFVSDDQV